MQKKIILYIFSFILIIGGIGIVLGGIFLNNKSNYYKENGILVKANVIDVYYSYKDSDNLYTNYYANIEYSVNNHKYESKYKTSTFIKKGDIVEIYYDKNNPQDNWHTTSNIGPMIMMIMGLICLIVGSIFFILLRKNKNIRIEDNNIEKKV